MGRLVDHKDRFEARYAVGAALEFLAVESRLRYESPFATGRAPSSAKLEWLVGHLLLAENDRSRRSELALEIVKQASLLSTRLRMIDWFGTHQDHEGRDPESEMLDAETTKELIANLQQTVVDAEPAALAEEFALTQLLSMLLERDELEGRKAIRKKVESDETMLALLQSAYSGQESQTVGEAAARREPRLNWTFLSELLGEEFLRQRLVLLAASIKFEALDAETAVAYEIADQIARGEIDPKSVAGLDLVSPAGRVTPDPEAQGGA